MPTYTITDLKDSTHRNFVEAVSRLSGDGSEPEALNNLCSALFLLEGFKRNEQEVMHVVRSCKATFAANLLTVPENVRQLPVLCVSQEGWPGLTARDLLEESDNPAIPRYLAGIDVAKMIMDTVADAFLIHGDYSLAFKAVARGVVDSMPIDDLEEFRRYLDSVGGDFWGCDGIPELDGADAEMLEAFKTQSCREG